MKNGFLILCLSDSAANHFRNEKISQAPRKHVEELKGVLKNYPDAIAVQLEVHERLSLQAILFRVELLCFENH